LVRDLPSKVTGDFSPLLAMPLPLVLSRDSMLRRWRCRRFQWVPVRVEVEMRKLQAQRPELGQLVPAPAPGDGKAKGVAESEMLLRGIGTA
jgi:hypothetical protein